MAYLKISDWARNLCGSALACRKDSQTIPDGLCHPHFPLTEQVGLRVQTPGRSPTLHDVPVAIHLVQSGDFPTRFFPSIVPFIYRTWQFRAYPAPSALG